MTFQKQNNLFFLIQIRLKYTSLFLLIFSFLVSSSLWARPDEHAPAGVMLDHSHRQGELMVGYRYVSMEMEGNVKPQ